MFCGWKFWKILHLPIQICIWSESSVWKSGFRIKIMNICFDIYISSSIKKQKMFIRTHQQPSRLIIKLKLLLEAE